MCGLLAAFARPGRSFDSDRLGRALLQMRNRGPDDDGFWSEEGVTLGHRRLAVIDLDHRAAQPMHSANTRFVIVYNGEIYNFMDLRAALQSDGMKLATTSDTEVLLELFARHGPAMLSRLRGMFSFVIWDREAKRGFAARDPYGIKPLYYAQTGHGALVASQVKALLATGMVSREPDALGQAGFWLSGSVAEPNTWFREVKALPAGHWAWIEDGVVGTARSWCDIAEAWRSAPAAIHPETDVRATVRSALAESVSQHLIADVPVGVFLSGGVDSGALAGLMIDAGASNLRGLTIAYEEFAGTAQDEAPAAARIAAHYGIEHHVRMVTRAEFEADLTRILACMDQPSIDGINTWYASKAVAECGLKVVVSGVGGDELFQGYAGFDRLPRLVTRWASLSRLPGAMAVATTLAGIQARRTGKPRWRYIPRWAHTLPGAWMGSRGLFAPSELQGLMDPALATQALEGFDPERWVGGAAGALPANHRLALGQIESTTYLRNQLLRDSDWASMDHSVELRTPLVDSWLLGELKPCLTSFERFPKKGLLATAPAKPLPAEIRQRPKTGFGIPLSRWLGATGGALQSDSRAWARSVAAAYEGSA